MGRSFWLKAPGIIKHSHVIESQYYMWKVIVIRKLTFQYFIIVNSTLYTKTSSQQHTCLLCSASFLFRLQNVRIITHICALFRLPVTRYQATISSVPRQTEIGFTQQSLMWKNIVCGLVILSVADILTDHFCSSLAYRLLPCPLSEIYCRDSGPLVCYTM
jgi:hypothetical protein